MYCAKRCWQGPNTSGVIRPCNRGQLLIIVTTVPRKDLFMVIPFRLNDEEIGEDRWQGACEHVDKVVQQHQTSDHFIDEQMDLFTINLADDSSSDSSDDNSTDTASETECLFLVHLL